jgi:DNA helicase HerA-like ATPase
MVEGARGDMNVLGPRHKSARRAPSTAFGGSSPAVRGRNWRHRPAPYSSLIASRHEDKTRVSVINLAGLGSGEAQQSFVNQLQMTLFTWIKRHPSQTGRIYVLDEAQNFAPSQAGTACKQSTRSLAAQARKYGLGMIFATQQPRGIDNAIVSNCTTHFYGRVASPAAIHAVEELMATKGGAADDIGRLKSGEFYFSTEGFVRPVKIKTPLCLSWHPATAPTAEEVVRKAAEKRQ